MTDDDRLIEFLDKLTALAGLPRADRLRAAHVEIELHRDAPGLGAPVYPGDDGRPWGRVDPETGLWAELPKEPLLKAGLGPPPFYCSWDGRFIHAVARPADIVPNPPGEAS